MDIREHIDALFADYKDSESLRDFKEELAGNLSDRIAVLRKKGIGEAEALQKALAELGDVSNIADELSMKKKQEVYSDMYMGTRKYLTPKRTALFILGGVILCIGLFLMISTVISLAEGIVEQQFMSGVIYIVPAAAFLTFMSLTQETAARNPMANKRAVLYFIAVFLSMWSILLFLYSRSFIMAYGTFYEYFSKEIDYKDASHASMLLALPGIAMFIFLVLTEKDRRKPWFAALRENAPRREREWFASANDAKRFGLFSAALWVAAIGVFVLLKILVDDWGWVTVAWIAIVAGVVGQILLLAQAARGKKE